MNNLNKLRSTGGYVSLFEQKNLVLQDKNVSSFTKTTKQAFLFKLTGF